MSKRAFSYEDYEATRFELINTIRENTDEKDKEFLISFNRLEPNWSIYDYQEFPAVKWKLLNLERFRRENPESYKHQLEKLESILDV